MFAIEARNSGKGSDRRRRHRHGDTGRVRRLRQQIVRARTLGV